MMLVGAATPSLARPELPDSPEGVSAIHTMKAMPADTRPLLPLLHSRAQPQTEINRVAEEMQRCILLQGSRADWITAVLD